MKFNLLEKVIMSIIFWLGKLHTGYIRDFNRNFTYPKNCSANCQRVKNVIQPRFVQTGLTRKMPLRNPRLALRKTNIFLNAKRL
jgi:hypothetical protein